MELEDIVQEILLRLPPKPLIRCKLLSKKWYNFISHNKCFRESYLSRNKSGIMLGYFLSKDRYPYKVGFVRSSSEGKRSRKRRRRYDDDDEEEDDTLGYLGDENIHILGCSNGFLLARNLERRYFITNPINKHWVALPPLPHARPLRPDDEHIHPHNHGFLFLNSSSSTDNHYNYNYKLVLSQASLPYSNILYVNLLSSIKPKWKHMSLNAPLPITLDRHKTVITERGGGLIYWLARICAGNGVGGASKSIMVIYDPRKKGLDLEMLETPSYPQGNCVIFEKTARDDILYTLYHHPTSILRVWTLNEEDEFIKHKEDGDDYYSYVRTRREWCPLYHVSLEITKERWPKVLRHWGVPSPNGIIVPRFMGFHPLNPNIVFLQIEQPLFMFDTTKSSLELVCNFQAGGWSGNFTYFPYVYPLIGPHLFLP